MNEDRIIFQSGLLIRKHYGETGNIKYYQILIPKQIVDELLRNLHGKFGTPQNYKYDNCIQTETLVSKKCTADKTMSHVMWAIH